MEDMDGQVIFLGNGGSLLSHLACHNKKSLELARSSKTNILGNFSYEICYSLSLIFYRCRL